MVPMLSKKRSQVFKYVMCNKTLSSDIDTYVLEHYIYLFIPQSVHPINLDKYLEILHLK